MTQQNSTLATLSPRYEGRISVRAVEQGDQEAGMQRQMEGTRARSNP